MTKVFGVNWSKVDLPFVIFHTLNKLSTAILLIKWYVGNVIEKVSKDKNITNIGEDKNPRLTYAELVKGNSSTDTYM